MTGADLKAWRGKVSQAELAGEVGALVDELREAAYVAENNPAARADEYAELLDRAADALKALTP
jgi:hypothetical protein